MLGLQFTQQGKITEVNKMEICESVDSSKVKITKVLLTPEDFNTLLGDENANYPIIPGRVAIGQISDASDFAYLNDYRGEYLDLSRGEAVNGSGTTKIGDCLYSLTNGTRILVHSKNLYNPPNSAGFKTCHAEELIVNSSTVGEMQSWSAATVLRVVFNLPNLKNARYYTLKRGYGFDSAA